MLTASQVVSFLNKETTKALPRHCPPVLSLRWVGSSCITLSLLPYENAPRIILIDFDADPQEAILTDPDQSDWESWLKSLLIVRKDQSLVVFIQFLCDSITKRLNSPASVPIEFWNWDDGCRFLFFLVVSSARYGGLRDALKPFPEVHKFGSAVIRLEEIDSLLENLRDSDLTSLVKVSKLDGRIQSLIRWIHHFQHFVLDMNIHPCTERYGAWKAPDFQVDVPSLHDPEFEKLAKIHGKIVAFHGSKAGKWYSIIRRGLEDRSFTPDMQHGAAFGSGIYFSSELSVAQLFVSAGTGWNHCPLGVEFEIIGVYDIIDAPDSVAKDVSDSQSPVPAKYIVVKNGNFMRLKSLLVWRRKAALDAQAKSEFRNNVKVLLLYVFILLLAIVWKLDWVWIQRRVRRMLHKLW